MNRHQPELYDDKFSQKKMEKKVVDYPVYLEMLQKRLYQKKEIYVWVTSLSQSTNPGWVIILTPLCSCVFTFFTKQKVVTTPTKIAFGLLISALSVLVMAAAVHIGNNGAEKSICLRLVANYGVINTGELFLSPMGLSMYQNYLQKNYRINDMDGLCNVNREINYWSFSKYVGYDDKTHKDTGNLADMFATALMFAQ
jgi:POT family proton-dependent oligopeptide transporter